ncbi:type III secretion system chaperone [Candidatus Williamhamiltonella defendens]|uniref:type III secretion system chaperone n=1 Tax=Candidatus Williamhamiltonella defendens TaxID=138072 RepID=UPI001F3245EB|nr:type III secretion system chaperone [Candidatus Hamiltonella defensa]
MRGNSHVRFLREWALAACLPNHNHHVYFFSPVMQITKPLSGSFFSSLLQIHLFGIAKNHCWFGYDTTSQHVILFCLIALDILTPDAALKH